MKTVISLVLAITVVAADNVEMKNEIPLTSAELKEVCKPYSVMTDYCNTCVCAHDGSSFTCTKKFCDKEIWNKDGSLKVSTKASDEVCTPNSLFNEYCNTCVCSKDGLSKTCTMLNCDENLWNKDGTSKDDAGKARGVYDNVICNAVGPNVEKTCEVNC